MSKYVNRLIAKLLKDKGYNLPCEFYWFEGSTVSIPTRTQYRLENDWNSYTTNLRISAPFISDVVDWLLEKHGIWISVSCPDNLIHNDWISYVYKVGKFECLYASHAVNTPTEAYLLAIEYTLKNLIYE